MSFFFDFGFLFCYNDLTSSSFACELFGVLVLRDVLFTEVLSFFILCTKFLDFQSRYAIIKSGTSTSSRILEQILDNVDTVFVQRGLLLSTEIRIGTCIGNYT
jgi:hypothetical protein